MNNANTEGNCKLNVVVTGFGPFMNHPTNASWEGVKRLSRLNLEKELGINLILRQLPVIYEAADKMIPKLWDDFNPDVVIHVGVYDGQVIQMETCAHNSGYRLLDIMHRCPIDGQCLAGSDDILSTKLDLEQLIVHFHNQNPEPLEISNTCGRYLCGYVYYLSLSIDPSRTLFVHVPETNNPYSVTELANHLKTLIVSLLKQINKK